MSLDTVTELLRKRVGLDASSLGPTVLPTVVAARQRALGIADAAAYAAHVQSSRQELEALVHELIVPETWFNRGGTLFSYLASHIQKVAANRPPTRPFRVLSAPCSTGEEPYSLAIALAELDVPRKRWQIDACDINPRHLGRARAGRYSELAFRQFDPTLRAKYFKPAEGRGWQIDDSIREMVQFRHANLVDPHPLPGEAPYDLIFCRNLLIYLHDAARRQLIDSLVRLLAPDGWIATGHAEPLSALDERFCQTGPDHCFLFARQTRPEAADPVQSLIPGKRGGGATTGSPDPSSAPAAASRGRSGRPKSIAAARPIASKTHPAADDPLSAGRLHADAGRLDEAWAACQAQLTSAGPSAEVFTLLGIVEQARQNLAAARQCFEKALYLDPQHGDSLLHLMLLCQQQGAHDQANLLRGRLERVGLRGDA
ncbi:MAG TPA: CheR family methyltransferase [Pirellulales bacterium]|nr:CheR family methyltransferase [Pirellulales bacterium]